MIRVGWDSGLNDWTMIWFHGGATLPMKNLSDKHGEADLLTKRVDNQSTIGPL
jgi:hypothetical protein